MFAEGFQPKAREYMMLTTVFDARLGPQKPAQGMILTTPGAQDAHQHLC